MNSKKVLLAFIPNVGLMARGRLQIEREGISPVNKEVELNRLKREAGDKKVREPVK